MQLKMNNLEIVLLLVIVGLINGMDSRALKRSETKSVNNVEKADPTKVNYDVYPVRISRFKNMLKLKKIDKFNIA